MLTTRLGLVASAFIATGASAALVLSGDAEDPSSRGILLPGAAKPLVELTLDRKDGFIIYRSSVDKIPIGNVTLIILGSSETIYRREVCHKARVAAE